MPSKEAGWTMNFDGWRKSPPLWIVSSASVAFDLVLIPFWGYSQLSVKASALLLPCFWCWWCTVMEQVPNWRQKCCLTSCSTRASAPYRYWETCLIFSSKPIKKTLGYLKLTITRANTREAQKTSWRSYSYCFCSSVYLFSTYFGSPGSGWSVYFDSRILRD